MNRKRINFISVVFACILFTSCSSDDVVTTPNEVLEIPDSRFETLLIEKGIDTDGVVNQQMPKEDALGVTKLELEFIGGDNKISDLTGIEGFADLTYLQLEYQNLSQIDISANIKLDTLNLVGNQIVSVDISNNPNLLLVDIQSNELILIEGLAKATKLKKLDLSFNYIEELSVHHETLEVLFMNNNDLVSLDINGAVKLRTISLTTNKLTALDLSTNSLLENLITSDNKFETLNLAQNTLLTHLYISSNSLVVLDLSSNLELVEIHVDRNPDLSCIKTASDQYIKYVTKSEHQELGACE